MLSTPSARSGRPTWLSDAVTAAECREAGRARRRNLPWAALGAWERGIPAMHSDVVARIAADPVSGLRCQLIGNPELACRRDARSGARVIDVDDLEDAVVGPWEWDVRRAAVRLACDAHSDEVAAANVRHFIAAYRMQIREVAARDALTAAVLTAAEGVHDAAAAYQSMCRGGKGDIVRAAYPVYDVGSAVTAYTSGDCITLPRGNRPAGESDASDDVLRWFAEYRENLPEAAAFLLEDCSVVDAVMVDAEGAEDDGIAVRDGDLLVLVRTGALRALLRARRARSSVWPNASAGADAQRILLAGSVVRIAADPCAAWCTDARRLGSVVWSTAVASVQPRGRKSERARAVLEVQPKWWRHRYAEALGGLVARAHAMSIDVHALSGYLGGSDGFDQMLTQSSLRARAALSASS